MSPCAPEFLFIYLFLFIIEEVWISTDMVFLEIMIASFESQKKKKNSIEIYSVFIYNLFNRICFCITSSFL